MLFMTVYEQYRAAYGSSQWSTDSVGSLRQSTSSVVLFRTAYRQSRAVWDSVWQPLVSLEQITAVYSQSSQSMDSLPRVYGCLGSLRAKAVQGSLW